MIVRHKDSETALCISQVHHSAMTGELARLWNQAFLPFPNFPNDLILAAALHDIGWTSWEENPSIDPKTGHPYDFLEMPKDAHLKIWNEGLSRSLPFSRLCGLLVFRHNTYLAAQQSLDELPENKKQVFEAFFKDAEKNKVTLLESLSANLGADFDETTLDLMNRFILLWDYISLRMCMGKDNNPFGSPPELQFINFEMIPTQTDDIFMLDPWPFTVHEFVWQCEVQYHKLGDSFEHDPQKKQFLKLYLKPKS